jgi:hypothetical protein
MCACTGDVSDDLARASSNANAHEVVVEVYPTFGADLGV